MKRKTTVNIDACNIASFRHFWKVNFELIFCLYLLKFGAKITQHRQAATR